MLSIWVYDKFPFIDLFFVKLCVFVPLWQKIIATKTQRLKETLRKRKFVVHPSISSKQSFLIAIGIRTIVRTRGL